ncbi:hypothetical protein LIER_29964 [Lithospermum erythrorhizon]|uniref:Uncharacterized protein n=1 Tax=Lithospermum erythrorhizon TaxID=34254 RepID=A0AAV3RR80_LITER
MMKVVVVSYTADKSRRRTRATTTALEKKRGSLGGGGANVEAVEEPDEAIDVEELEKLVEKRKEAKRPSVDKAGGFVPKKRKGENVAKVLRERSKRKLKVNDNRNIINNRRITKNVEDVPTEGVDFNVEELEARWKFICMVREFVCNLPEDLDDPDSTLFHKVKMRGLSFNFRLSLISQYYGITNIGITGASLKLADIVGELTGNVITEWPAKVDHSRTRAKLKTVGFPSLIYNLLISQHPAVLRDEDVFREDTNSLTISDKLMKGKHIIDVELNVTDQTEVVLEEEAVDMLIKAYKEDRPRLEAEIQAKRIRVSELQTKIQALKTIVPPAVNDPATTSTIALVGPTLDVAETSKSPM